MRGAPLTASFLTAAPSQSYRFELRSAQDVETLATAPLPLGLPSAPLRRGSHRDVYLDTADDALRARGITCRLRITDRGTQALTLRGDDTKGAPFELHANVHGSDVATALGQPSIVTRRLRALIDPALLVSRLEVETDRITRLAGRDILLRPRFELHYDRLTVRKGAKARSFFQLCCHQRAGGQLSLARLAEALADAHRLRRPVTDARTQAELFLRWSPEASENRDSAAASEAPGESDLLSPELSLIAFQERVLALAEDPTTPLKERLRFIGIVSANVDELYMVRVPEMRDDARRARGTTKRDPAGFTPGELLARVERRLEALRVAQWRCAEACLTEAAKLGTCLLKWKDLTADERDALRRRCRDEVHPSLTPLAMTLSPGHPLPHLPHLALNLAVVYRRSGSDKPHLAELELPNDVPRLLEVPGRPRCVVPIEEALRANADLLHSGGTVEGAYLFRVTRGGALALDEESAESLLTAVATATARRPSNPAVRVEVERSMPDFAAALVLESLRRDAITQGDDPAVDDVEPVDGLMDLRALALLPLPDEPGVEFPPLTGRDVVPQGASLLDTIRERDLLAHHPFDDFEHSVVRFVREAADDPNVTTIRMTLYRVGEKSPIVNALLDAARGGKRVAVFVELKARFDEEHNVTWARALEAAGGHVVTGLVGLKTHAKAALVVRREGDRLRRYVHVGTGNYNVRSGRQYTDLSLFSARDDIADDVTSLFNGLTGSSGAPAPLAKGALVAPEQLLPSILDRIAREAEHARAGRPSGIAIKVNGLSDTEVVRALYDASRAGVRIRLMVRGICTLAPGVAGQSENITVRSVVGRFLEHSRIYRFENGGDAEYFIGSSDLRPRNLRRRVELLVPVPGAGERALLDRLLAIYLGDDSAWVLQSDGSYRAGMSDQPGVQQQLAREAAVPQL